MFLSIIKYNYYMQNNYLIYIYTFIFYLFIAWCKYRYLCGYLYTIVHICIWDDNIGEMESKEQSQVLKFDTNTLNHLIIPNLYF